MSVKKNREYRTMPLLRLDSGQDKLLDTEYYAEGYATTFDKPYLLYKVGATEYFEAISRDAFVDADMSDVIFQYDHAGKVLARNSNKTLVLKINEHGLLAAADLSKSEAARSLHEEIKNGLVTKMSWAFTVIEDSYDRKTHTRIIEKIGKVYDVSAVSIPANADTEISARSYVDGVIDIEKTERLERNKHIRRIKLLLEV